MQAWGLCFALMQMSLRASRSPRERILFVPRSSGCVCPTTQDTEVGNRKLHISSFLPPDLALQKIRVPYLKIYKSIRLAPISSMIWNEI